METAGWLPLLISDLRLHEYNFGTLAALAPTSYRPIAVSAPSWDLHPGPHPPGFSQSYEAGSREPKTAYSRVSSEPVEPLVVDHEFHALRPDFNELSEEFRLFHNLAPGTTADELVRLDDSGNATVVARVGLECVEVETPLVRQFQAAKQMDLLLFIDSVVHYDPTLRTPADRQWITDDLNASLSSGDAMGTPFTRFLATRVITPWPIERSGVWPFEAEDDYFPEFIVGVDEAGHPQRFTCDPGRVANYFGANPGAPLYVTPVHFRRDVLAKYFDRPDLYTVEDGYLRCGGRWGVRIDNDLPDRVIVMLGDLGRDLPASERDYWRSFNIPPSGSFSETAFRRGFLAEFADAEATDLQFQRAYPELQVAWRGRFGWALFRTPEPGDRHLLSVVRRPLHDTDSEFEQFIRTMTKLLVDLLNERDIERGLEPVPEEKGIAKLERRLRREGYPDVDRDISFLRMLQEVRSKGAAHSKGSDYEKVLTKAFGPLRRAAVADKVLADALVLVRVLSTFARDGDRAARV